MNLTECGVCQGQGRVLIVNPTAGPPQEIQTCTNCGGQGAVWAFGTFAITFKRSDELPATAWKKSYTRVEHTPERWVADLRAAGWRERSLHVWERPDGALFRGPYGAWCALFSEGSRLSGVDGEP